MTKLPELTSTEFNRILAEADELDKPYAEVYGYDLRGLMSKHFDYLQNVHFMGCDLRGMELKHSHWRKCMLSYCYLDNTITHALTLEKCIVQNSRIQNGKWQELIAEGSDFRSLQFEKTRLTACSFSDGVLENVEFRDCDLTITIFHNVVQLTDTVFRLCRSTGLEFCAAKLDTCSFPDSLFPETKMWNVILKAVDLSSVKEFSLTGSSLKWFFRGANLGKWTGEFFPKLAEFGYLVVAPVEEAS